MALTVSLFIGVQVRVKTKEGYAFYAFLTGSDDSYLFLSDVRSYHLGERGPDSPKYKWEKRTHGKVAIPLTNVAEITTNENEPTEGGDTGLDNPFFNPEPDPKPAFATIRHWWEKWFL